MAFDIPVKNFKLHKTLQLLHECVLILKCESIFTVAQFHRFIKNMSENTKQLVGDSGNRARESEMFSDFSQF